MQIRCEWVPAGDPLYAAYHDEEWGVPVTRRPPPFEMLTLEGAQAGLSWATILRKREGYRQRVRRLRRRARRAPRRGRRRAAAGDPGIVRNRLKVESAINNARCVLAVQEELGSLDAYLWGFVGGEPLVGRWRTLGEIPAETAESRAMSRDLKRRGFRFVGPTVCYAFMQATGLVNDHVVSCFRFGESGGRSNQ